MVAKRGEAREVHVEDDVVASDLRPLWRTYVGDASVSHSLLKTQIAHYDIERVLVLLRHDEVEVTHHSMCWIPVQGRQGQPLVRMRRPASSGEWAARSDHASTTVAWRALASSARRLNVDITDGGTALRRSDDCRVAISMPSTRFWSARSRTSDQSRSSASSGVRASNADCWSSALGRARISVSVRIEAQRALDGCHPTT